VGDVFDVDGRRPPAYGDVGSEAAGVFWYPHSEDLAAPFLFIHFTAESEVAFICASAPRDIEKFARATIEPLIHEAVWGMRESFELTN
jgi:hypothetical protein